MLTSGSVQYAWAGAEVDLGGGRVDSPAIGSEVTSRFLGRGQLCLAYGRRARSVCCRPPPPRLVLCRRAKGNFALHAAREGRIEIATTPRAYMSSS